MERLPKRTSLVVDTAATLKEWIRTGVLHEVLPGELQLKTRLRVGRDTLRLALKMLAQEGWVSAAAQGLRRRVAIRHHSPRRNASPQLPVTFLSPYSPVHRLTLLELEDLQSRLAEQGRALRFASPAIFHQKHPDRELERLVREQRSAAWILYVTNEAIQHWFEKEKIPTLLFESPFPGIRLPFVTNNWESGAFHVGAELVRRGHRVIGILECRERRPGLLVEERGLQRALRTAEPPGRVVVFKDDFTPASVAQSLELAFDLKERPTALVLTRAAQLLTCYSWLASRGIRTPADVSLVSLPYDSWFADLYPPVCHYRSDHRIVARHLASRVLELMATGQVTKKSIRIPIEYVPGATIGPAPASGVSPRPKSKVEGRASSA